MTLIDGLVILLYLAGVMAIGRYFARRQHNTEEFFLGGGRLPWFPVALSAMATLASTVGYLSMPGEVMQYGIGMLLGQLALPLAFLIIMFVIIPCYQRSGVTTAFELLGNRCGQSTRILGVAIWAYMQVAFLGLVLLLASRVVAMMVGIPVFWVIIVIGVASVIYTSAGGMQSVVWTDVLQAGIMFLGTAVSLTVVMLRTETGPATWLQQIAGRTHALPPMFSNDLAVRHTIFGTLLFGFIVNISYAASEQTIVQRYNATPRAVLMMFTNFIVSLVYTIMLAILGGALLVFYLQTPTALPAGVLNVTDPTFTDQAFPVFIIHHLPAGLTGLVIAALLGAAQSTVDSGVNSMSAVFSKDVIPLLGVKIAAGWELKLARWVTRIFGVSVVIVAILVHNLPGSNNIVDIAQKVVHLGLGPLGGLFLAIMLLPRVGTGVANSSLLSGFVTAILLAFHDLVTEKVLVTPILIIPISWLVTFVLAIVFSQIPQLGRIRSTIEKSPLANK